MTAPAAPPLAPAPGPGPWRAVDPARLRPGGPRALGASEWALRAAAAAGALALGWFLLAALRPLPAAPAAATADPFEVPRVPDWDSAVELRERALASLTGSGAPSNIFAAGRRPWPGRPVAAAPGDDAARGDSAPPATAVPLSLDRLPPDVKQALDNLELKSLHLARDGTMVAAIAFSGAPGGQPGQPGQVTRSCRAGDSFRDPKFPQHEWVVESIDAERDAVILRRGGVGCTLPLYRGDQVVYAPPPRIEVIDGVPVRRESRADVEAQLRKAGLPDDKIREALKALDEKLAAEGAPPAGVIASSPQRPAETANPPASAEPNLGDAFRRLEERRRRPGPPGASSRPSPGDSRP